MEKSQEMLEKIVEDISSDRHKVIDDFLKAYIASRIDEKGFAKKIPKLILVEQRECNSLNSVTTKYWFEIKKGRVKNKF